MKVVGFRSFNQFRDNIKELKQFYDLVFHLLNDEHKRVDVVRKDKSKKVETLSTSTGIVNHSLNSLHQSTETKFPNKLRQLILISTVTTLEVYMTDLIQEIFNRDKLPFQEQQPIEFTKNQILTTSEIEDLHKELIRRDKRRLTSGGLKDITKYYKSKFKIEFSSFPISINKIEEIHTRRHLHVHRNGICDLEYANKYPKSGIKAGSRLDIDHKYLMEMLDSISKFGAFLNKSVLGQFPKKSRGISHYYGPLFDPAPSDQQKLLIELTLNKMSFDIDTYTKSLTHKKYKFTDYLIQITTIKRDCKIIIKGEPEIIRGFFSKFKLDSNFKLKNVIELKNNV